MVSPCPPCSAIQHTILVIAISVKANHSIATAASSAGAAAAPFLGFTAKYESRSSSRAAPVEGAALPEIVHGANGK